MPVLLEKDGQKPTAVEPATARWSVLRSGLAAGVALAIFALVNAALFTFVREKMSTDMWGGTGSIDIAVGDYARLKQRPGLDLLGSSLVMYPFWAMDKEKHPNIPDIFHHHESLALEDLLAGKGIKDNKVYSFAIFGQMVSDAFIYVNEYLKGDKAPRYLVYGIAPRDFSDYDLPAPMATLTFKRLVGLANLDRYAFLYLPGLQDKADFVMSHLCYFYGHRWRLQKEVSKGIDKVYTRLGIAVTPKTNAADSAGFMIAGREDVRWNNSLHEYERRYRNIGEKDLSIQMSFLRRLLAVCRERGIKVILVNMPLTDLNRGLFPQGFYARFRRELAQTTAHPGVTFLDLGESADFTHADFWDTTHLNHAGGRKLLTHLAPSLTRLESCDPIP